MITAHKIRNLLAMEMMKSHLVVMETTTSHLVATEMITSHLVVMEMITSHLVVMETTTSHLDMDTETTTAATVTLVVITKALAPATDPVTATKILAMDPIKAAIRATVVLTEQLVEVSSEPEITQHSKAACALYPIP